MYVYWLKVEGDTRLVTWCHFYKGRAWYKSLPPLAVMGEAWLMSPWNLSKLGNIVLIGRGVVGRGFLKFAPRGVGVAKFLIFFLIFSAGVGPSSIEGSFCFEMPRYFSDVWLNWAPACRYTQVSRALFSRAIVTFFPV